MTIKYKNETPIHPSQFLTEIENGQKKYQSTFLGNMTNQNNELVDLYFLVYKNGEINAAYQFGEEESEYGSGFSSAYNHLANGRVSEYTEIYKRAISAGLLKEEVYYAGYSDSYADELYREYESSDYYQARPKASNYYGKSKPGMNDVELDVAIDAYDEAVKKYNKDFEKEHGPIPKSPGGKFMHIFKDLDQARLYCPKGKGRFNQFNAINEEHLEILVRKEDFFQKIRQDEREINSPSNERDSEKSM